jgi:hypothetical protein
MFGKFSFAVAVVVFCVGAVQCCAMDIQDSEIGVDPMSLSFQSIASAGSYTTVETTGWDVSFDVSRFSLSERIPSDISLTDMNSENSTAPNSPILKESKSQIFTKLSFSKYRQERDWLAKERKLTKKREESIKNGQKKILEIINKICNSKIYCNYYESVYKSLIDDDFLAISDLEEGEIQQDFEQRAQAWFDRKFIFPERLLRGPEDDEY